MIYIVSTTRYFDSDEDEYFVFFETTTDSFFGGGRELLSRLMKVHRMNVVNMDIIRGELRVRLWYNEIHRKGLDESTGSDYILLCRTDMGEYKLISYDKKINYVDARQLRRHIQTHNIANCDDRDGHLKSMDTYKVTKSIQFEHEITKKYERYTNISAIVGCKLAFEYTIEGQEVRLMKYTGIAKDVIIPNFVTAITEKAFLNCKIEALLLEPGLKSIGNFAFEGCKIGKVIIPETVRFIGLGAFHGNKRLVTDQGEYKETIRVLNKNTTILDKYNNKL